jgi:hypothetical protein
MVVKVIVERVVIEKEDVQDEQPGRYMKNRYGSRSQPHFAC